MFSLQRLISGDGEFFDLLETSAEQSTLSVKVLLESSGRAVDDRLMASCVEISQKNAQVTDRIFRHCCRTLVTPLDREDIERLATALARIPSTLETFLKQLLIAQSFLGKVDFSRQMAIIAKVSDLVLQMVKDVRNCPEVPVVQEQNSRLQHLEGEADKILLELLKDLYSGRHIPINVIAMQSLYELLEKAVDRFRDVGNVLVRMAMKLS